jgi:DNA-binding MarR family transcriptional regulator
METAPELNEQLMECIFRLFSLLRRGPRMTAGEPGANVGGRPSAQNRILLMLNESDGISQRDMTTLLQLRPQSVSETLSKLEAGGLVERRQNSRDKRVFNVFMTEEGKARAQELVIDRPDFAAMFLSALSPGEKRTLLELLMKLTDGNDPEEPECD